MNNEIKFDPMTGEPINNNVEPIQPENTINQNTEQTNIVEPQNIVEPVVETQPTHIQSQIQTELQNIPTVDQNEQQFINNVQSINNKEKKEDKKEGINFTFIIIMFVIILLVIIFLFPILLDYI